MEILKTAERLQVNSRHVLGLVDESPDKENQNTMNQREVLLKKINSKIARRFE